VGDEHAVAMSNLHRILWIDSQLRADRHPNASRIAEQFEISRRQAARDLEYMRDSLGAPLEFCAAENGYRYRDGGFALPAVYLSEDERETLDAAATGSSHAVGAASEVLARFLMRAGGSRPPEQLRRAVPTALRANAKETRTRLQRAIESRRVAVIKARGPAAAFRIVRLHPYRFTLARGDVDAYVIGYSERTGTVEGLHLAFIDEVQLTERRFPAPPPADLPSSRVPYLADVAIARRSLPASLAERVCWVETGRCRIPFESSETLLGALLAQPAPFRIVGPAWLARRLVLRLGRLLDENAFSVTAGTSCVPPSAPDSLHGLGPIPGPGENSWRHER
jgi:predicted DNA-binding transcriptional regulator YafY